MLAIYNGKNYYLLPEWATDIQIYLEFVRGSSEVILEQLNEKDCFAPDFLDSSITKVPVNIDSFSMVIPVNVNVYTKEEYDAKLLDLVLQFCPGCNRYSEGGLEGHYSEMSLLGVCDKRNEGFSRGIIADYFWTQFRKKEKSLKKYLDTGKHAKAEVVISELYSFYFQSCGCEAGKIGDKYVVCLFNNGYVVPGHVAAYLISRIPEDIEREWRFFNSLIPGYKSLDNICDVSTDDLVFYITQHESVFSLRYSSETIRARYGRNSGTIVYKLLCSQIGERTVEMLYKLKYTKPLKKGGLTLSEVKEFTINHCIANEIETPNWNDERKLCLEADREALNMNDIQLRHDELYIITSIPELGLEFVDGSGSMHSRLLEDGINSGFLFIPSEEVTEAEDGMDTVFEHVMINLAPYSVLVGQSYGYRHMYYDFLIFDSPGFFAALRSMTPMLKPYDIGYCSHNPDSMPKPIDFTVQWSDLGINSSNDSDI